MRNFGLFLKNEREKKGWSKWRLYQESDVSYPYISLLEKGTRENPAPEILKKLSKAMEIPYEKMLDAAGYLDGMEKAKSDVLEFLKLRYAPLFDDENDAKYLLETYIREAVVDEKMRGFLSAFYELPADRRDKFLDGIIAMMKGFGK